MNVQEKILISAADLAEEVKADAILVLTEKGDSYNFLKERVKSREVIAFTPNRETYEKLSKDPDSTVIDLTVRDSSRMGQIRQAVWWGLNSGLLSPGDIVVCLSGELGLSQGTDTISVYLISETESTLAGIIEADSVMNAVVNISTELGWKGREGEPLGTAFIIGDVKNVMEKSHQLGLNIFEGHEDLNITNRENWELIKRYAFLDGAFVLDEEGNFVAAGRYLDADVDVDIKAGLGTRHIAVAKITAATGAKGVTVSGTDGVIRIFSGGKIMGEIDPRSKMLKEVSI